MGLVLDRRDLNIYKKKRTFGIKNDLKMYYYVYILVVFKATAAATFAGMFLFAQ